MVRKGTLKMLASFSFITSRNNTICSNVCDGVNNEAWTCFQTVLISETPIVRSGMVPD